MSGIILWKICMTHNSGSGGADGAQASRLALTMSSILGRRFEAQWGVSTKHLYSILHPTVDKIIWSALRRSWPWDFIKDCDRIINELAATKNEIIYLSVHFQVPSMLQYSIPKANVKESTNCITKKCHQLQHPPEITVHFCWQWHRIIMFIQVFLRI